MLFKWLFTLLAILWLIKVLRPLLQVRTPQPPSPPPPPPPAGSIQVEKRRFDESDGDYIDYEDLK